MRRAARLLRARRCRTPRPSGQVAGHPSLPAEWRAAAARYRDRRTEAADRLDHRTAYPLRPAAPECRNVGGIVIGAAAENGRTCDQHVGPCLGALPRDLRIDTAVDLEVDRP